MNVKKIVLGVLVCVVLAGVGLFTMNIVTESRQDAGQALAAQNGDSARPNEAGPNETGPNKKGPDATRAMASSHGVAQGQGTAPGQGEQTATPQPAPADTRTFATRSAARDVTLTAFTRARSVMELVSEESGRCLSVAADVGQTIGADGVFARLDTTYIRLDLEANRAEQARSQSDLAYYSKERSRYETLVRGEQAAQSTLDDLLRNEEVAKRQLQTLRIEERRLMERMARYTIKAPEGWQVMARDVEPGEWVNTGQVVGTLGNYTVLLVPFAFTPEELAHLRNKAKNGIVLTLPDYGGKKVTASVERVNPGFDPETRKIGVDLVIEEGDFDFRGGIRCQLTVDLPDPGGSVLVPDSALLKAYEEYFLVKPDGQRVRVVLLGSADDGMRRVSAPGLASGQDYLLNPVQ